MEVATSPAVGNSYAVNSFNYKPNYRSQAEVNSGRDALVLQYVTGGDAAEVNTNFESLGQGLAVSAQEILKALNKKLEAVLPEGIESLRPEDNTSEATADRIVSSIVGLFDAYVKSNPELAPDEAIERFVAAAQSGVDQGYDDAYEYLKGLGAFEFEGVEAGIAETKKLIGQKLDNFRQSKLQELSPDSLVSGTASARTLTGILTNAGSGLSVQA